ncbi:AMP-binding protein, partial [Candidatus Sumerlaeota bacterium]|nr:AMP-binding protein [Candidatus Sumerlaeota bacterium]
LFLTTALLNEIVRKVPDAFATLRVLMFGGEAVNPKRIAEILKHGAPQDLIHLYGPAENTTLGTWHRVRAVPEGALTIPIGKPVANSRVYLLDGDCRPVPIGVTGEIYVGGDGLARGYLRRPELTEQQFLEVALRRDLRERLYRTGDLGRYLADGSIEFQGRADNQIKLRGLRIELGEIEAALRDHAEVAQAIVDFQGSGQEDKKLVAYVVPRAGCAPSHSTLRNHLKPRLPAFMIPAQFGLIRELPLTPNGKVDRECLPTLTAGNAERDAYVPPRTAVERRLQEIWERVLNMRPIGREDGFFELGGHSLLAIKLMEEIEIAFGRRLPLTSIFTAGTYRRQAELLRKNARSRSNPHVAEIQSEGAKPAIYFPQSGRFAPLLLHDLACALGKDRPLIALQASWLDAEKPKFGRIEDMSDFYIRVLKEVQPQGPYFLGGYCIGGLLAYEMARRLEAAGESAPLLVMIETFPENAVYSPIMTGIERVGRLLNWPEERMIKTFLRIREWGIFLRRVWSKLPRAASRGGFNQLRRRLAQSGWWRSQPVIEFANQPKLEMGRSEGTENVGERPQNLPQYPIDPSIRILFETERHLRFAYVPRPYYGRTMVFMAEEVKGGRFGTEALNQRGWRRVARGRLDDFEVPGDHFGILRQPSVEFIAKRIQSALEEIERQAASV